jgi:hypothetical protein
LPCDLLIVKPDWFRTPVEQGNHDSTKPWLWVTVGGSGGRGPCRRLWEAAMRAIDHAGLGRSPAWPPPTAASHSRLPPLPPTAAYHSGLLQPPPTPR